jgi:hypothetical protein
MRVDVKVLTGASSSQTGATAVTGGTVSPAASITTTVTGSRVYGAIVDWQTNATLVANTNTTIIGQTLDGGAPATYANLKAVSATGTPGAISIGCTNASSGFNLALAEILPFGASASPPRPPRIVSQAVTRAAFF